MCPENSGLRQAISELIQRWDEAQRHGVEHCLASFALRLALVWCVRAVWNGVLPLVLGESVNTGRTVGTPEVTIGPSGVRPM